MSISDEDLQQLLADEPGPPNEHPEHGGVTDLTTAEQLADQQRHNLRYCHSWEQWLYWDDGRWQTDQEGRADHLAKLVVRRLLAQAAALDDDQARKRRVRDVMAAERAGSIAGCLKLARSEPGVPVQPAELDANPWQFNCANGTLDLRTGDLRPHRRQDLITRQAPAAHDPAAQAPLWQTFLARVLPDAEIRMFLQRAAGYCMTGGNPEQILLILYGAGANGKSTYLETMRALFGDYGQQAPPETFLERRDQIPNDIARLRGARLVAATELSEGRRLNEPLIKRMTGGDTMTARFMRSEYFEFEPQFTPWLGTNHRPEIRGTDEAIWRRVRLVPFTETIPANERDGNLKSKLRTELPGILNWALDGCLAWQADGLNTPQAVVAATAGYRAEMDLLGAFLEECCREDPSARGRAAQLYAAYVSHSKANGNDPVTSQTFGRRLTERGFKRTHDRHGRLWEGLRLIHDQENLEI